ncbi:MAG: hypothetical protein II721_03895, partial [Bacilli bacterium]|nr:hypothetical protein [Bacilli bacterium]
IDRLVRYLLDTITLGTTDTSSLTTYNIYFKVSVDIPLLNGLDTTIEGNAFIYLDGTNVKVLASIKYEKSSSVGIHLIEEAGAVNIFFETTGEDSEGDLYISRCIEDKSDANSTRRVTGANFMDNIGSWLVYILNLGDTISGNLNSTTSSKEALHGEDLIKSFTTAGSFDNPQWNIKVGLGAILPSSINGWVTIDDPTIAISGATVSYTSGGKTYNRRTLSSLSTDINVELISILSAKANLRVNIANVSNGKYTDGWNSGSTSAYYMTYKENKIPLIGIVISTDYTLHTDHSGTPAAIFSGQYGKSSSNSTYRSTPYYVTPDTRA